MKITFLTPTLELHGGTLILASYANRLAKAGHEITIISPDRGKGLPFSDSIVIKTYPALPIRYVDTLLFQAPYFKAISSRIEECDFIIPIYTPLLKIALRTKLDKKLKAKIVLVGQEAFEMPVIGSYNRRLLQKDIVQKNLEKIVAVSAPMVESYKELVDPSKVQLISNGIDLDTFSDKKLSRENYLLFVGRPNLPKGYPLFKSVVERLLPQFPDLKAKVIAPDLAPTFDGPVEHIRFESREQLASLYGKAAVYVCASTGESFGLPALEAMACGTPVVTTATAGSTQYAIHERNCLVVPVGETQAMTAAVSRLLTDKDLADKLSAGGLQTAKQYDGRRAAEEFLQLLETLGN